MSARKLYIEDINYRRIMAGIPAILIRFRSYHDKNLPMGF